MHIEVDRKVCYTEPEIDEETFNGERRALAVYLFSDCALMMQCAIVKPKWRKWE